MKTRFATFIQVLFLGLLLMSFISCKDFNKEESVSESAISPVDEEKEIKNTLIAMWAAIENEDMDVYASYIHTDFTQFGETDSVLRIGKESELQGISSWVSNAENIHTEMLDPRVTISENMAFITYYWSDRGIENGLPFATRGKSTRIFIKEDGKWLCVHGHYTSLP